MTNGLDRAESTLHLTSSPEEHVDVVVVGAGPAGILAAHRIAASGRLSVLLVEAGRHYTRRGCPVDRGNTCRGCSGICNVISGFGGSIHFGDGVKLSQFPSGRRLLETFGPDRARQLSTEALRVLCGHDDPVFRGVDPARGMPGVRLKDYPVADISSEGVRRLVERLYASVIAEPRIDLRLRAQVISIDGSAGDFTVRIAGTGPDLNRWTVRTGHLVVAVGRRGQRWWRGEIRRLGMIYSDPVPSVGLRFECPVPMLAAAARAHPDFKTTMHRSGVKVKTFCLCAGPGGGRVKFTDYGEHTLLDGHVIPEAGGDVANFALLAQLRDDHGRPRSQDWIDTNILGPYRKLRTDRPGKPVLQWYPDFRSSELTCHSLADFARRAGFAPTLRDYQMADLSAILPDDVHAALCAVFEDLMTSFSLGRGTAADSVDLHRVGVIGLELESLWDELAVTASMETSIPGLYACGDCSGLAQGILQAATAGLAAADDIVAQTSSSAGKRTAVTS